MQKSSIHGHRAHRTAACKMCVIVFHYLKCLIDHVHFPEWNTRTKSTLAMLIGFAVFICIGQIALWVLVWLFLGTLNIDCKYIVHIDVFFKCCTFLLVHFICLRITPTHVQVLLVQTLMFGEIVALGKVLAQERSSPEQAGLQW